MKQGRFIVGTVCGLSLYSALTWFFAESMIFSERVHLPGFPAVLSAVLYFGILGWSVWNYLDYCFPDFFSDGPKEEKAQQASDR